MEWDELPALFPDAIEPERWLPLLQRHAALIREAEARVRVSSVPGEDVVRRQYAESLETWRLTPRQAMGDGRGRLVDVGSGGGFPGLVIAAVEPGLDVHLVDPLLKRAALLGQMSDALGLTNVTVHAQRAETAGRGILRETASVAMARAVADARELIEYVAPFAAPGGVVVLPKGSRVNEEVAVAANALRELGCDLRAVERMRPEVSETLSVVVLRKVHRTPEKYPRRAGIPARRPL